MSDWGWVSLGYASVYGVVVLYTALLMRRLARVRRDARVEASMYRGD